MTTYTDSNGTAWYVNLTDATELPPILRGTVGEWLDTDIDPWEKNGRVDEMYFPLTGDDEGQLEARKEILESGDIPGASRGIRIHGRRSGLHTDPEA